MGGGIKKGILGGLVGVIFLGGVVWAEDCQNYLVVKPTKLLNELSPKARVISYLKPGTKVIEVEQKKQWIKVKVSDDVVGWVNKKGLKPLKEEGLCQVKEKEEPKKEAKKESKEEKVFIVPKPIQPEPVKNEPSNTNIESSKTNIEKKEVTNVIYVKPNRVVMVEMSSLDINRVYCDGEITDVVFSEEKGVKVKIVKNNAFVKFVMKRIEDQEIPIDKPVDLFFVCDNQVYSLIAIPKRIPSAFIYLESKGKQIQEVVERAKDLPYEKKLLDVIKAVYLEKYEPNYQVVNVNKEFYLFKELKVILEKVIDIEGEGLRAKVFKLETNFNSNTQYIEIKEKDFVRKDLTSFPLAVSLDKAKLQGRDKATLIILEKRIAKE
jgi:conjugal transfer pilus assembly protein TraK